MKWGVQDPGFLPHWDRNSGILCLDTGTLSPPPTHAPSHLHVLGPAHSSLTQVLAPLGMLGATGWYLKVMMERSPRTWVGQLWVLPPQGQGMSTHLALHSTPCPQAP